MGDVIAIILIAFIFSSIAMTIVSFFEDINWGKSEVGGCLGGTDHSYDDFGQCYNCGKIRKG